jgi:hypothetical protein
LARRNVARISLGRHSTRTNAGWSSIFAPTVEYLFCPPGDARVCTLHIPEEVDELFVTGRLGLERVPGARVGLL